ncbi:MAG TPA: CCA tRNA nucleotidyltransferase [Rhizomicrobium sp.]|nr:CCA tRNA nucleotidyltransferase [Rhizomicrobium sp.]
MTRLDPQRTAWMQAKPLAKVMAALGGEARYVGGAVRNTLMGRQVKDIDIATPLVPQEVVRRLEAAGLKAVPTGIEHGTITAVADRQPYEVTTLRRDVETDGRRAVVAFATDWKEDAARRDFTINALYASADGAIFDYHNGLADLKDGRVRFIGDAVTRIREDYLRILRLFRFHAWYGKGEIDSVALKSAAAEKSGLQKLSGERIAREFLRLLEADNPLPVLRTMAATGILSEIIPATLDMTRLERLCAIDGNNFFTPDPVLRLAALLGADEKLSASVAERFRLSNKDRARIEDLAGAKEKIVSYMTPHEVRKFVYRLGIDRFSDRVFLRWAGDPKASNAIQWRALREVAKTWPRPVFPLTGRDVMNAGVPEGPLVGQILNEVEEWWIDADFTDDEFSLAERLKAVVQATAY